MSQESICPPGGALRLAGAQTLDFNSLFTSRGQVGSGFIGTDGCSWDGDILGDEVGSPCRSKILGLPLWGK